MTAQPRFDVAIHVALGVSEVAMLEAARGWETFSVVRVDLSGIGDRRGLCQRLGEAFVFPYSVTSLDAVVDLVSDLAWLGNDRGYLVTITGLDTLPFDTLTDAVGLLPAICDRWRSQQRGFVVLLIGSSHRAAALVALADANAALSAAAEIPWVQDTKPVEIVDHGAAPSDPSAGSAHTE